MLLGGTLELPCPVLSFGRAIEMPCDTLSRSDWSVPSSEVVYTLEQVGETKVSQQ